MTKQIDRAYDLISVALTTSSATSPTIPFGSCSGATVLFPATYASTSLDIYAATDKDANDSSTWIRIYQGLVIAAEAGVELPSICFPCSSLRLVTDSDDSALSVAIHLKG